jgi:hypothetical protein
MTIKDFGARVADVWAGLRPATQKLVVGAMQNNSIHSSNFLSNGGRKFSFDAHADWELSDLLKALDERAADQEIQAEPAKFHQVRKMANACADVLQAQTESAEVFIQLAVRALKRADFARVDALADSLIERFSAGEICEIARQAEHAAVRALAMEALALVPIVQLLPLLDDPLYAEIARNTLETQAVEYNSEDAKMLLEDLAAERFFNS